jgi:hypothetical protein
MSSMLSTKLTRRRRAAFAVATAVGLTMAGCGSGGPTQSSGANATMWSLTTGDQPVIKDAVERWNKENPDRKITVEFFASDAMKAKMRTAVGAGHRFPQLHVQPLPEGLHVPALLGPGAGSLLGRYIADPLGTGFPQAGNPSAVR